MLTLKLTHNGEVVGVQEDFNLGDGWKLLVTPETLHPTSYALHPTPHTPFPASYALCPSLFGQ